MTLKKEFLLELHKLRHRRTSAIFLLTFALIAVWMYWCIHDLDLSRTNDATAIVYMNLLLMNTILCPIAVAALASRLCDMEQAGNTLKWLCTIQKPEHIYRGKVLTGGIGMAAFSLMQTTLFGVISSRFDTGEMAHNVFLYLSLFFTLFLTSLSIFILQLNLSLKFTNQLTPVFISIGGTFAGLFSWFLGQWPLRYIIPWGYYAALCSTGIEYDKASRYTSYYWEPYPILWSIVLLGATAALYYYGQKNFLKTARETM